MNQKTCGVKLHRLDPGLTIVICVCLIMRYRLNVFLPPLPEDGGPKCLEIRNPWGKIMEISGLTFENFY